ncbi:uncharacterized protein BO80DRAFT_149191 [Aspergillus ibericus CBS 121593]|uniref:Uncharacterized protein n=1 Tax=Aspergillus ibericus CBS 121593 TaxID=1448316 RepID=A0A395GUQ5_9EURO|nr:hypothetical protein BO80DRAFT_149191 [Aspergillus ibericus CBS 121593]RAK98904.1 hypothetical protein BO80DRAFT_149191 [Aspergillus ibericus CBS 121593]
MTTRPYPYPPPSPNNEKNPNSNINFHTPSLNPFLYTQPSINQSITYSNYISNPQLQPANKITILLYPSRAPNQEMEKIHPPAPTPQVMKGLFNEDMPRGGVVGRLPLWWRWNGRNGRNGLDGWMGCVFVVRLAVLRWWG